MINGEYRNKRRHSTNLLAYQQEERSHRRHSRLKRLGLMMIAVGLLLLPIAFTAWQEHQMEQSRMALERLQTELSHAQAGLDTLGAEQQFEVRYQLLQKVKADRKSYGEALAWMSTLESSGVSLRHLRLEQEQFALQGQAIAYMDLIAMMDQVESSPYCQEIAELSMEWEPTLRAHRFHMNTKWAVNIP